LLPAGGVLYLFAFLGGLAGSLHCVGMCGVFPLALARARRQDNLARQVLYNAGRLNTLAFVGALSGGLGAALVTTASVQLAERVLAVVAGVVIVLVGLEMLGVVAGLSARFVLLPQRALASSLGSVLASGSRGAPLALGVVNAFLPCHLVYAFAARAAATASALEGALVMLAFGLGTLPAMLTLGLTRLLARPALRSRLSLAAGVLVVAFGVLTVLRGVLPPDAQVHLH